MDISVFLRGGIHANAARTLRAHVSGLPHVKQVYFESRAQAWAEFQRLYTCSEQVPRAQRPDASLRVSLYALTQAARDDLVRRIEVMPGVSGVSCDPSNPCIDVTPSPR